jgi:hypothetical protein
LSSLGAVFAIFGEVGSFSGTLSYFDITRRNVMNLLPGAPFLAVQIGEQRARGFDMDPIKG